jgi:hypothetical protein
MGEGKKAIERMYVLCDTGTKKPHLPSIYFQFWIKYLEILYNHLNDKKQNGLISGTAVQRKLIGLIYTLWKKDEEYIENYQASI